MEFKVNTKTHVKKKDIPLKDDDVRRDRMMDYCVELTDLKIVKPGEHWCPNMTLAEAIAHTENYIKGTNWAGRVGFEYFNKGIWIIRHIDDVSKHAKSINRMNPHAKWDEAGVFIGIDKSRSDSRRETFNMPFAEYMSHRNTVVRGSGNIAIFPPHEFQDEYAEFRNERIIRGTKEVGNESVTRWGKTFGEYNADLELLKDPRFPHKHMKTLVYSGKPKVFPAWERDINHVNYDGWVFKNSQEIQNVCFEDDDTNEYIVASAQGNHKGSKQRYISRIKQVLAQWNDPEFRKKHFCKVVLEECHTNLLTLEERKFIESLNADVTVPISGTMGKLIVGGIIDIKDIYRFSLIDAMEAKANNHFRFKDFPTPLLIINNHSQVFTSEDPENPNFAKALSWTGTQPTYSNDVDNIFTSIASDNGSRKTMPLLANSRSAGNIPNKLLNFTTKHGWIVVPRGKGDDDSSVGAQSTVEYWLNNTSQAYWNKYKSLPVSDGGMSEAEVNRQQHQNEYTQVISGGALNTGTTFEKLDHQIWLTESSSYSEFWQTVGRLFEMMAGKDIVPVVLPSWSMYINMVTELALYSQKPGQTYNEVLTHLLDMLPGIDWSGEPKMIDYQTIIKEQLKNNVKGSKWSNPTIINLNAIDKLSTDEKNDIPDMTDTNSTSKVDINGENGDHNRGKDKKVELKGKKTSTPRTATTAKKIADFLKYMPSMIANAYIGGHSCKNHIEIFAIPDIYFDSYIIPGAKDNYKFFISKNLIDTNEIDKRVEFDHQIIVEAFKINSVLSVVKEIQQSVPIPKWKVLAGKVGTGIFVSSTVCDEWTTEEYLKTQTWCVFGTGEGYVYFELAKRLIDAGHSPVTVFTSGMLVGYDIDTDSVNILKEKIEHTFNIDKDKITVYNKDYLNLEETMNFDNFIINSPYLDGSKGNIPVSHKHIGKALEHWNRNGKGFAITKSSPALSNERYGDEVRHLVSSKDLGFKFRWLPDNAFPNATVKSCYLGFDKKQNTDIVQVYGKDGNFMYDFIKNKDEYFFVNKVVKDVLEIVKTSKNTISKFDMKRVDRLFNSDIEVPTITLIKKYGKQVEKSKKTHKDFGKYAFGMRFQMGTTDLNEYHSHTSYTCLIEPEETIKKDYAICVSTYNSRDQQYRDTISGLYQIRHPLNMWIHAHTKTSEQSSRSPQFKFCCRIPTDEFYNAWSDGNPSVTDYFDFWNIPADYQTEILDWSKKYV